MKKLIVIFLMLIIVPVYALEDNTVDRKYIENNKVYTNEITKQKIKELGKKIKEINKLDAEGKAALKKEIIDIRAEVKTGVEAKKKEAAAVKVELNTLKSTINNNHQKILSLIVINKNIRKEIKAQITKLKDSNSNIDQTLINQIKNKTAEIKNYGQLFKNDKGVLTAEVNKIKLESSRYNYTEIKNRYNNIITIQNDRIKKINDVNAKLLEIKTLLNV